jgi:hypothetical protein
MMPWKPCWLFWRIFLGHETKRKPLLIPLIQLNRLPPCRQLESERIFKRHGKHGNPGIGLKAGITAKKDT